MDKHQIKSQLLKNHHAFVSYLETLSKDDFLKCSDQKWTAAQQLAHIFLSVKPLGQILSMPKFMLKLFWGQANRQSMVYDDFVNKYLSKLASGGKATGRFVPRAVNAKQAFILKSKLKNEINRLVTRLDKFSEAELDKYVLPHPLLGKLTLREMLYFTAYHVSHHEALTKKNLV